MLSASSPARCALASQPGPGQPGLVGEHHQLGDVDRHGVTGWAGSWPWTGSRGPAWARPPARARPWLRITGPVTASSLAATCCLWSEASAVPAVTVQNPDPSVWVLADGWRGGWNPSDPGGCVVRRKAQYGSSRPDGLRRSTRGPDRRPPGRAAVRNDRR